MSVFKRNIAANFGGSLWTGLMSLVFVPFYIHFMGIEAYGLVGIFATLLGLFGLLDMGLSNTLNREMARLSVLENKAREMRDLLRTLEIPYWIMAGLISIGVVILSPLIAYHWVNAQALPPVSVHRAVIIMGIAIAFQWPLGLYSGGLMGLQRQVLLSGINVIMATCRGVGAVLVLWLISPTVEAFFAWQIVTSATHTGLIAVCLWQNMPKVEGPPHFRSDLLIDIWRFAAGVTGITVFATILTQLDKIILSRMLTLEMFGCYALSSLIAMSLYRLVGPVMSATYPRLTNLVALGAKEELARLYHASAQLVSVITLPVAIIIAIYSREIMLLWTQNPVTVQRSYLLVSILVIGTALNGLMNIPYALQLASGWTKLGFIVNFISVLLLAPLTVLFTKQYGAVGAAWVWLALNSGYVLIDIQFMHRRLLPAEKWHWYREDIGLPLVAALATVGAFRLMMPVPANMLMLLVSLALILCVTLGVTALCTSVTRSWVQTKISEWRVFREAAKP